MEQDILTRLEILEKKIDMMYVTVDKLRRYFLVSTILTVVFFVLPLIIAVIAIPFMINTVTDMYGGLL
jgi:TRAP-type mannitol/chloroaromatic compound transport system permease small subunit